ncbi:gephyrin-like molybdotransferase Glp [Fibrobacterota bacterium]
MITFEEAKEITLRAAKRLPAEKVPLQESRGRILAEDIHSDLDLPVQDLSAMDGFACRRSDLGAPLEIIETIPAGSMPKKSVGPGQCSRIMTGAAVPRGADLVVMYEHTREENGMVTAEQKSGKTNIRRRAEDIKEGDCVLRAGTRIHAAEIAVLASVGCASVPVSVAPLVGVIATGDELVEPGEKPDGACIRNSNSYQLCAQIEQMNCRPRYFGIGGDKPEELDRLLKTAMAQCDVILLSGGVSMGDFDYVPDVLRRNNIELLFEKVSVKPGKPTVFGLGRDTFLFGLPGNPVSTLVCFEMLVKPFLFQLLGHSLRPLTVRAKLEQDLKRKKAGRSEFVPVKLTPDGKVQRLEYHGSGHIHAYTRANGVIYVPRGIESLAAGTGVDVILM